MEGDSGVNSRLALLWLLSVLARPLSILGINSKPVPASNTDQTFDLMRYTFHSSCVLKCNRLGN